jgi:hypothetical protein
MIVDIAGTALNEAHLRKYRDELIKFELSFLLEFQEKFRISREIPAKRNSREIQEKFLDQEKVFPPSFS